MLREAPSLIMSKLAEDLAKRNIRLETQPGSPLAELVNCNQRCEIKGADAPEDAAVIATETIANSMSSDLVGNHPHDDTMSAYVKLAADSIRGSINVARNVVNPKIIAATEALDREVSETLKTVPLQIIIDKQHSIWRNGAILDMVSQYNDTAVEDKSIIRAFPTIGEEELRQYVSTGSASFNSDVAALLDTIGIDVLRDAYVQVFQKSENRHDNLPTKLLDVIHPGMPLASALMIHLLARRLFDNIPDGVEGLDLATYKDYVATIVAQTGRVMFVILSRRENATKVGRLVLSWPIWPSASADKGIIVVNEDLYPDFLEKGGSPEVLFGALQSGDKDALGGVAAVILEKAEAYKNSWKAYRSLMDIETSARQFDSVVRALRSVVAAAIRDAADEELVVERTALHERLNAFCQTITSRDIDNIPRLVRRAICQTMFIHTDAEEILESMDEYLRKNEGMSTREAALFAIIRLTANWVSKQITPVIS